MGSVKHCASVCEAQGHGDTHELEFFLKSLHSGITRMNIHSTREINKDFPF